MHANRFMASGGSDGLVALWDLADGTCARTWSHMDHPIRSISLSADGAFLAYATESKELEVCGRTAVAVAVEHYTQDTTSICSQILSVATGERLQDLKLR